MRFFLQGSRSVRKRGVRKKLIISDDEEEDDDEESE